MVKVTDENIIEIMRIIEEYKVEYRPNGENGLELIGVIKLKKYIEGLK